MKEHPWMPILALTVFLTACASPSPATPPPSATATLPSPKTGFITSDGVVASAEVVPAHEASLSFMVSGPVKQILVKEGEKVTAGQTLLTLYSPELELSVTAAELAVKSAELEYQYWVPRYDRPPERHVQARAELDGVKAQLETARATFAQTSLLAPFDATVVDIRIQPDEYARAGQVVIVLGDLAHLQVATTDLSERDIPAVSIGQHVNIYLEALNDTITGRVMRVSPISETVGGDVVYPVIVELDEQAPGLLWGMTAEVEILTK